MSRSVPKTHNQQNQIWSEHISKELKLISNAKQHIRYTRNPRTVSLLPDNPTRANLSSYWTDRKASAELNSEGRGSTIDWVNKYQQAKIEAEKQKIKEEQERAQRQAQAHSAAIQRAQQAHSEFQSSSAASASGSVTPRPISRPGSKAGRPQSAIHSVPDNTNTNSSSTSISGVYYDSQQQFIDEFMESLHSVTLSPRSKYALGWDQASYKLLINDNDQVNPIVTRSDVTKFNDEYIAACGYTMFGTKSFKWGGKHGGIRRPASNTQTAVS